MTEGCSVNVTDLHIECINTASEFQSFYLALTILPHDLFLLSKELRVHYCKYILPCQRYKRILYGKAGRFSLYREIFYATLTCGGQGQAAGDSRGKILAQTQNCHTPFDVQKEGLQIGFRPTSRYSLEDVPTAQNGTLPLAFSLTDVLQGV